MNTVQRYSKGAIALHWLIALTLAGQIALGFAMPRDASGFALYQLHKSIGITILALSLLRLGWRFTHARPARLEGGLNGFVASAVHALFYVTLIALPLTGWALVSTAEIEVPTVLFGIVPWPHLPLPDGLAEVAEESHEFLAWGAIALFALHVAGALRHHLLLRDGVLARMSPRGNGGFALAMLAALLLLGAAVFAIAGGDAAEPAEQRQADTEAAVSAIPTAEPSAANEAPEDAVAADEADEALAAAANAEADAPAPPPVWTISPGGSLRFSIDNSGSALSGGFSRWSGDITMDPANPATAELAIRVELASASLGNATQDAMLGDAPFFNAAAFPSATWRSTSVRSLGGNRYEADGTLTLKGASRPQRISFTLSGSGNRRQVQGSATIDRTAFGVGTGENAAGLANSVALTFSFDAVAATR